MPITEFAILRNRTTEMVRFTYGGQTQEVKPGDKYIASLELTRWLFTTDACLGLAADNTPVYKLGIEEGPESLGEYLGIEFFDTDPVTLKASREHPDLAASRPVKLQPVSVSRADFAPESAATR